jgi:hypothetical protein
MTQNNKLKLEDITFDDFISEGLKTDEVENTAEVAEKKDEEIEDSSKELVEDVIEEEEEVKVSSKKNKVTDTQEEEVEVEEVEEEVDETVVNEVLTQLGYEFPDEDFEDTADGLVKLAKAVGGKIAEDQLDGIFQAHPEIQKHLDYVLNGGKSKQWLQMSNKITDFENIKVTQDDVRTQRAVLGEYFKLKGHDDDFVNELLDDYTDTNKLYDKATKAKAALTDYYGKERDQSIEKEKKEQRAMQQKQREFWDEINDTIQNSKDFAGLTVQEKDKKKFFDFLTQQDGDGKTEREKAHRNSSTEVKLAMDYLMFKGFNLNDIISAKAKTKSVQSLRKKIKSSGTTKSASRPKRKGGLNLDTLDLNLNNL